MQRKGNNKDDKTDNDRHILFRADINLQITRTPEVKNYKWNYKYKNIGKIKLRFLNLKQIRKQVWKMHILRAEKESKTYIVLLKI